MVFDICLIHHKNDFDIEIKPSFLINQEFERRNLIGSYNDISIHEYADEGKFVPHFHLISKDNRIDTCIRLDDNKYFHHGKHKSYLNRKELVRLVCFLNTNHKTKNITNWEYMVLLWNEKFPDNMVTIPSIPDYKNIR